MYVNGPTVAGEPIVLAIFCSSLANVRKKLWKVGADFSGGKISKLAVDKSPVGSVSFTDMTITNLYLWPREPDSGPHYSVAHSSTWSDNTCDQLQPRWQPSSLAGDKGRRRRHPLSPELEWLYSCEHQEGDWHNSQWLSLPFAQQCHRNSSSFNTTFNNSKNGNCSNSLSNTTVCCNFSTFPWPWK